MAWAYAAKLSWGRGGLGLVGNSLGDSQLVLDPGESWPSSGEADVDLEGEVDPKMESILKLDIFLFSVDIVYLVINHDWNRHV